MRALVIGPHCDDAELGVGGYIAKMVQEGGEVMVVVATVGDITFRHLGTEVSASARERELAASMEVLGVQHYQVLVPGYDSVLHTYPMGKLVSQLDAIQEEFKPDEVLLPLPSSHQDHKYVWEACVASTRPSQAKHRPRLVAAYEYPASGWGEGSKVSSFSGGMYVNVSDTLEQKVQALSAYESQMRGPDHLFSLEAVRAFARVRGIESGYQYAELLYTLRQLRD